MSDSDNNSTNPEVEEQTLDTSPAEKGQVRDKKLTEIHHDHDHDHGGDGDEHHQGREQSDVVRDIIMWRRSLISAVLVVVATALWVMLEIYRFIFLPLASYTAIGFISLLFLYGCILALLRIEVGEMKRWEISEEKGKEIAASMKGLMERGIRWMFHISCEREWYIFAGVVTALLLLGYLARHFNLHTLVYAGTMVCMSVPVIYVKREEQITAYGERVRAQADRLYAKFDHQVLSKF